MMNKAKLNVYRKVLHKVCEKSDAAEEFIKTKIEEICLQKKLLVKEVSYFASKRLCFVVAFN